MKRLQNTLTTALTELDLLINQLIIKLEKQNILIFAEKIFYIKKLIFITRRNVSETGIQARG